MRKEVVMTIEPPPDQSIVVAVYAPRASVPDVDFGVDGVRVFADELKPAACVSPPLSHGEPSREIAKLPLFVTATSRLWPSAEPGAQAAAVATRSAFVAMAAEEREGLEHRSTAAQQHGANAAAGQRALRTRLPMLS